jgi:hypothetical protein
MRLDKMVTNIPRIKSALDFFVNTIFVCHCCFEIIELRHIFIGFISDQRAVILISVLVFICRPTSLLA